MKNNMYNMKTKISIIKEFNNGLSRKELAEKYDISYFLLSTWIKQRDTLLQAYELAKKNRNLTSFYKMKKLGDKRRCILGPRIERKLDKWIIDEREKGVGITNSDIQTKALELSKSEQIHEFVASLGWIYSASQHSRNVTIQSLEKQTHT